MVKRSGKLAIGAFILAGLGYVAGILTAPKSGRETRRDIKKVTVKAKKEAEKKLKQLHSELSDLIDKAKGMKSKAQAGFSDALDKAVKAKEKVRVMLSVFHEGDADDADLQKAINDAKKAYADLKKFVTK